MKTDKSGLRNQVALPGALGRLYDGAHKQDRQDAGIGGATAALVRIGAIVAGQGFLQMAQVGYLMF